MAAKGGLAKISEWSFRNVPSEFEMYKSLFAWLKTQYPDLKTIWGGVEKDFAHSNATFGVMKALNFTLNSVTMLALVLMVGIVIDDAIVVLENIFRFVEEKKMRPREAARGQTGHLANNSFIPPALNTDTSTSTRGREMPPRAAR